MKVRLAAVACLLSCLVSSSRAQTTYTVTDLGTLPGATSSYAQGLNDFGDVVGSCSNAASGANPIGFRWSGGVMTSTGLLPKGNYSYANAINGAGVVVGGGDTGNFRPQAWVQTHGGLYNFFPNNGGNTHAVSISDSGAICGYYTKSLSGWVASWKAAIWTPDPKDPRKYRTTDLPILAGVDPKSNSVFPARMNQVGQVVGAASNDVIGQHAVLWNNDAAHTIVDLGTLPDDWSSLGYGINDFGMAVGSSYRPWRDAAVLWMNDEGHTPIDLGTLPGDTNARAVAINNAAQVIGYSDDGATTRVFIWDFISGMQDLHSLLDASGDTWTLWEVTAINNRGQIVGFGMHEGLPRGFLLTPAAQ